MDDKALPPLGRIVNPTKRRFNTREKFARQRGEAELMFVHYNTPNRDSYQD
jgi:hypothetical protein